MKSLVCVPVADLRREPKPPALTWEKDLLQESQLTMGEEVVIKNSSAGWHFVEAVEQPKCYPDGTWNGYTGWVKAEHICSSLPHRTDSLIVQSLWAPILSAPTRLSPVVAQVPCGSHLRLVAKEGPYWKIQLPAGIEGYISEGEVLSHQAARQRSNEMKRASLVSLGLSFLGFPYLWGGRTPFLSFNSDKLTSVDCSGLASLLYRSQGICIPRDAHDQFLRCIPSTPQSLEPGDLVFSAEKTSGSRISHVMIFIGHGILLESSTDGNSVRRISFKDKFGCDAFQIADSGHTHLTYLSEHSTLYFAKTSPFML